MLYIKIKLGCNKLIVCIRISLSIKIRADGWPQAKKFGFFLKKHIYAYCTLNVCFQQKGILNVIKIALGCSQLFGLHQFCHENRAERRSVAKKFEFFLKKAYMCILPVGYLTRCAKQMLFQPPMGQEIHFLSRYFYVYFYLYYRCFFNHQCSAKYIFYPVLSMYIYLYYLVLIMFVFYLAIFIYEYMAYSRQ